MFGVTRRAPVAVLVAAALATAAGSSSAASSAPPGGAQPDRSHWTRNSRTFHEGRKNVTVLYGGAVNFRDAHGNWQPIDDTLVPSAAAGYAYENKADAYTLRLPSDLSAAVDVELGSRSVALTLRGAHGQGVANGRTDRFANALPQTSVAYTATSVGARETLTLASPSAPQSFTYDLGLAGDVTAHQDGPRAVAIVDGGRHAVAYLVAPWMRDDAGSVSNGLRLTLAGSSVTLKLDRAWLASASRQWPVTVDPDVLTFAGANQDTYISSGSPDTFVGGDPLLRVGSDGTQAIRGLLNFQLDTALPSGSVVDAAQLALYLESESSTTPTSVSVYGVTDPWIDATWNQYDWDYQNSAPLPWNTPGGDYASAPISTLASMGGTTGTTYTLDVTQLAQDEVDGALPPYGFLLKEDSEAGDNILGFTSSWAYDGNPVPTLTVTWEAPSTSGPQASLDMPMLAFGSAPVGTATPTQGLDVTNSGDAALSVSGLTIVGADPTSFAVVGSTCLDTSLAPGASCSITLDATPTAVGNLSATLQIADNAPNSPQLVPLSVTGTAPPAASVTPSSLVFGYARVGYTSAAKTVTVTSTGGVALTINGVSRAGANPSDFVVTSNTCWAGTTLAPGDTCTIAVAARPRARGTRTATLRIFDNAADSAQSVALSVTGY
jgi:hypothetical protein